MIDLTSEKKFMNLKFENFIDTLEGEDIFGKTRQTYEKQFERAVWKICKQNDSNWMRVYKKSLPN